MIRPRTLILLGRGAAVGGTYHRAMITSAVSIGVLVPLSRPGWVEAGEQLLAGLELGVRDVNEAGGIGGTPLELVVRDTAADPQRAADAVDELAALGVAALAGEYHSVVARAAAARADALGVPFLCSSAVLDELTDAPTNWVARLPPPQSRGWQAYADFLLDAGHRHVAVVRQPSVYWDSGTRILREHFAAHGGSIADFSLTTVAELCDDLAETGATALLLLVGHPDPAVPIVRAVRSHRRLSELLIGAPAGQPELASWADALGDDGVVIPFLRYLPSRLTALGVRVEEALRAQFGAEPSFVAFEGYDTIAVLAEILHAPSDWSSVSVTGTRGEIGFSRTPGVSVWQWTGAPIQVVDRDPADGNRFRVRYAVS